jgi:hypothetical protein
MLSSNLPSWRDPRKLSVRLQASSLHVSIVFFTLILSIQLSSCGSSRGYSNPASQIVTIQKPNPPSVDSGTGHIQSVIAGSHRIQRIISEAKAGTEYRISFVASTGESAKLYQGYTTPDEGSDKNGITIHVAPGLSDQLTELILAHELFHIVLQKQGMPSMVHFLLPRSTTETSFEGAVLKDAGGTLMNCYPDALIDEWMEARGFTPKLINRRQFELTIQDSRTAEPPLSGVFPLYRRYFALVNYCLSIRARDFEMDDIFKAYQRVLPTMKDDQASLEKQLGTSITCSDARSCLEATKTLRRAAGFEGQIFFLNRFTNAWQ